MTESTVKFSEVTKDQLRLEEFEFGRTLFETEHEVPKYEKVEDKRQYLITIDGKIVGYTIRRNYGLEIIRAHFEQAMREVFIKNKGSDFRIKREESEDETTYKLYQISRGNLWNTYYKMVTVTMKTIHRVHLCREDVDK